MAKVLLVDDEPNILRINSIFLKKLGLDVITLNGGEKVLETVKAESPDLVVTDIMMPGITGGTVYGMLRSEIGPKLPIIVSSASRMKINRGEDPWLAYCPKPMNFDKLEELIDDFLSGAAEDDATPAAATPQPATPQASAPKPAAQQPARPQPPRPQPPQAPAPPKPVAPPSAPPAAQDPPQKPTLPDFGMGDMDDFDGLESIAEGISPIADTLPPKQQAPAPLTPTEMEDLDLDLDDMDD